MTVIYQGEQVAFFVESVHATNQIPAPVYCNLDAQGTADPELMFQHTNQGW